MMEPQEMTETSEQKEVSSTPFEDIISRVKSYADNPELATAETMSALLADLEDLRQFVDEEDSETPVNEEGKGGISIILGKMGKGVK